MPPVMLPEGLTHSQEVSFVTENFKDRGIDTNLINPVFIDWRDDALMELKKLKLDIRRTIGHKACNIKTKEGGEIILKHIPSWDDLLMLHYTEIKEIKAYAERAWYNFSKRDIMNLIKKDKDIRTQVKDIKVAKKELYAMK